MHVLTCTQIYPVKYPCPPHLSPQVKMVREATNIKRFTPQELDTRDYSRNLDTAVLKEHLVLKKNDDDCSTIDFAE